MLSVFGLAIVGLTHSAARFPTNAPQDPLNTLTAQQKGEGWKLLFNGNHLESWESEKGDRRVKEGIAISRDGPGHLFTENNYKNFELSWTVCDYDESIPKKCYGNSGVFLRAIEPITNFPRGCEFQVDSDDIKKPTCGIDSLTTGDLLVETTGGWNPKAFFEVHEGKGIQQRARIVNQHITEWINREKTLEWIDPDNRYSEAGYIALQKHHANGVVLFANVKIKELA